LPSITFVTTAMASVSPNRAADHERVPADVHADRPEPARVQAPGGEVPPLAPSWYVEWYGICP
jgi:hypothetical protein